jgi:hypothetical protein
MKTLDCWQDLKPYGVVFLTGEACGLMYRLLCDVTEKGRKVLGKCFGIPNFHLGAAWNSGSKEEPHVGSILLTLDMLTPVSIFALLENGCTEVWHLKGRVIGFEPTDSTELRQRFLDHYAEEIVRRYAYQGTAGHRNIHVMSGRVD